MLDAWYVKGLILEFDVNVCDFAMWQAKGPLDGCVPRLATAEKDLLHALATWQHLNIFGVAAGRGRQRRWIAE